MVAICVLEPLVAIEINGLFGDWVHNLHLNGQQSVTMRCSPHATIKLQGGKCVTPLCDSVVGAKKSCNKSASIGCILKAAVALW